jgi:DNA-binding Lrp family transcriptional regulator
MTVSAYLLVQTDVGRAADVADSIRQIDGITDAHGVTGPYDLIVRAEADTLDELGRMVVSRVQMVDGIMRTTTCPVVNL